MDTILASGIASFYHKDNTLTVLSIDFPKPQEIGLHVLEELNTEKKACEFIRGSAQFFPDTEVYRATPMYYLARHFPFYHKFFQENYLIFYKRRWCKLNNEFCDYYIDLGLDGKNKIKTKN